MKIIFTNTYDIALERWSPEPASKNIPDWYRNLNSYINDEKRPDGRGNTTATMKRCMPVFDMMTGGYIIPTWTDIYISDTEDGNVKIEAPEFEALGFHAASQAGEMPGITSGAETIPKWFNPWSIKTPKGYSCLFIAPTFRDDSIFKILPGIVDTDEYTSPVNFPFIFTDPSYRGYIPAGTPMAQVIPFKRDSWELEIGGEKEFFEQKGKKDQTKMVFFDGYKRFFRSKKEYK